MNYLDLSKRRNNFLQGSWASFSGLFGYLGLLSPRCMLLAETLWGAPFRVIQDVQFILRSLAMFKAKILK